VAKLNAESEKQQWRKGKLSFENATSSNAPLIDADVFAEYR
jgi:hypothetical protein